MRQEATLYRRIISVQKLARSFGTQSQTKRDSFTLSIVKILLTIDTRGEIARIHYTYQELDTRHIEN